MKISVIGCGYLGSRVAALWRERGDHVVATTRQPRQGEVEGTDYHFIDHASFRDMIAADRFPMLATIDGDHPRVRPSRRADQLDP